jgi:hypothetical protein
VSDLTQKIEKTVATLDKLVQTYLDTEGKERYLKGIAVNKYDAIYRARATVIAGLPSLKLEHYADAKRARKIA